MRTPAEVARQIKKELRSAGIFATARSRNYQVYVTADRSSKAREIALEVYHRENHNYMMVWVDDFILPMPPFLPMSPIMSEREG